MSLKAYDEIILHCGLHKTGSSFIQETLGGLKQQLAQKGIDFPGYQPRFNRPTEFNHSLVATRYTGQDDINGFLQEYLNLSPNLSTLLISGEEFSRSDLLQTFLPALVAAAAPARVRVLIYLRRFDHILESVYAESVKRYLHGPIEKASFNLHYNQILDQITDAVGAENTSVRPFTKHHWPNGRLLDDFLTQLGCVDLATTLDETAPKPVNVSLSRSHSFLLSQIKDIATKRKLMAYFEETPLKIPPDTSKFFMPLERRKMINDNHAREAQPTFDALNLGSVEAFLGPFDYEEEWQELRPNWRILMAYMSNFASWLNSPPQS